MSSIVEPESAQLSQSFHQYRNARPRGGLTVGRCCGLVSRPDPARQGAGAVCTRDRDHPRLQRPDRPPCHSRRPWPSGHTAWVIGTSPHTPCRLRPRPARAVAGPAPSESTDLGHAHQRVDARAGGRSRRRRGSHSQAGQWNPHASCPPKSWPTGFVRMMDGRMQPIDQFPKRLLDMALAEESTPCIYATSPAQDTRRRCSAPY
jgi:hypothetical protein